MFSEECVWKWGAAFLGVAGSAVRDLVFAMTMFVFFVPAVIGWRLRALTMGRRTRTARKKSRVFDRTAGGFQLERRTSNDGRAPVAGLICVGGV